MLGQPELLESLKKYHKGEYKYIVVTNGAKQALSATFYAYKQLGKTWAYHPAPYWPSYPTLSKLVDLPFRFNKDDSPPLEILTSPNNPNGQECVGWQCDIWDAAYFHPVYGATGKLAHEVSIWSASKLFGISGLRIGWLATNNEKIAKEAATYVEKTTSGVNVNAQYHLNGILYILSLGHTDKTYENARNEMLENGKMFMHYLGKYIKNCDGVPVSGKGGFAWFQVENPNHFNEALKRANVRMIPGSACGGGSDWFRASMVYDLDHTGQALEQLSKEL